MKTYHAHNEAKTRLASVEGRHVKFFLRARSNEHYVSPLPWWHDNYPDHEQAVIAADHYIKTGKVRPSRVRQAEPMPLFEEVMA